MTALDWKPVATALLGTWPTQVATWGREGISAYLTELQARGLTPEQALIGIRTQQGAFPPSAGQVADAALRDPSIPTYDEFLTSIHKAIRAGRRPLTGTFSTEAQMIGAREELVRTAARSMHPLIAAFLGRCADIGRLESDVLEALSDGEYAGARRRELEQRWEQLRDTFDKRERYAIASGQRDGLRAFDPLTALGLDRPELEQKSGT